MQHDNSLEVEREENWVGAAGIALFLLAAVTSRWFLSLALMMVFSGCSFSMQFNPLDNVDHHLTWQDSATRGKPAVKAKGE